MSHFLRLWALALVITACGGHPENSSHVRDEVPAPSKVTRYPIVLHHGLLGFDRVFFIDYFYKVPELLTAHGYTVRVTHVPPVNTIAVRSKYLARQIDEILAETGAEKVNIVAHSLGGLDARYLISAMGYANKVASVTTLATPHEGSPVADAVLSLTTPGSPLRDAVVELMTGLTEAALIGSMVDGQPVFGQPGSADLFGPVDIQGVLWNLSTTYTKHYFNPAYPDDPGIFYQSYGGQVQLKDLSRANFLDPILSTTYSFIYPVAGENDGLVSVKSARHGLDHGALLANHADIIGQVLGQVPPDYDYRGVFVDIADDLAARGY